MIVSHGKRLAPHLHEMDEYERIIHDFQRIASTFHRKQFIKAKQAGNETKEERKARLADRRSELEHLKREAIAAKTRINVQIKLEKYRQAKLTQAQMLGEQHHPTAVLEKHLSAHGKPKPSPKHTAHHIIPGKGKTQFAADARIEMHLHGIRINDPYNGVWMLRKKEHKPHWSMPNSHAHLEIHTHNYEKWVFNRLILAETKREAEMALDLVGKLLQDGNQPPEVTMPPDDTWNA